MSPIKRSFFVVIPTFSKALLIAFYGIRNIICTPWVLGYGREFSKFVSTLGTFFFGHKGIFGMNPIPFRMMPLKELLFFKALISRLQIHSVCTIGEKF